MKKAHPESQDFCLYDDKKVMKTFNRFIGFVLTLFALTACKEPEITVTSLSTGKSLPQPILLNYGIVNAFPNTQKYLRFAGSCHVRVNGFEIAYNEKAPAGLGAYNLVSSTEMYDSNNDGTDDTNFSNDLNCSDGNFDFVLSLNTIFAHLGVATIAELETKDVISILIRGLAGTEQTLPLELLTSNGGGSVTPKYLALETENYFRVIPAGEVCVKIEVEALSDSLYPVDSNKISGGSYQVQTSTSLLGPYSTVDIFSSFSSCETGFGGYPTQTLSSTTGRYFYLNVQTLSGNIYLKVTNANANYSGDNYALSSKNPILILKVDTASKNNTRFMTIKNFPHSIVHDFCYAVDLHYASGDTSLSAGARDTELSLLEVSYSVADGVGDNFGATPPPFKLYRDSGCTLNLANSKLSWSDAKTIVYLKYNSSLAANPSRDEFARIKLSGVLGSGKDVYGGSRYIRSEYESGAQPKVAKISDHNSFNITSGTCQNITLNIESDNGNPITSGSDYTLNLFTDKVSDFIKFYDSPGCVDGNSFDSRLVTIEKGQFSKNLSYQIEKEFMSYFQLKTQISTYSEFTVNKMAEPAVVASLTLSTSSTTYQNSCTPISITPGFFNTTLGLPRLLKPSGSNFQFYTDYLCNAGSVITLGSSAYVPPSGLTYMLYYKASSIGNNQMISVEISGFGTQSTSVDVNP